MYWFGNINNNTNSNSNTNSNTNKVCKMQFNVTFPPPPPNKVVGGSFFLSEAVKCVLSGPLPQLGIKFLSFLFLPAQLPAQT